MSQATGGDGGDCVERPSGRVAGEAGELRTEVDARQSGTGSEREEAHSIGFATTAVNLRRIEMKTKMLSIVALGVSIGFGQAAVEERHRTEKSFPMTAGARRLIVDGVNDQIAVTG